MSITIDISYNSKIHTISSINKLFGCLLNKYNCNCFYDDYECNNLNTNRRTHKIASFVFNLKENNINYKRYFLECVLKFNKIRGITVESVYDADTNDPIYVSKFFKTYLVYKTVINRKQIRRYSENDKDILKPLYK
jgi:hypothetical protein